MSIVYTVLPEGGRWRVVVTTEGAGRVLTPVFERYEQAVREALDRAVLDRMRGSDARTLIVARGKKPRDL